MDAARKNNDCYFYYYSTCLKGDGCLFRHEPSALGCETVCTFWQQGKCLNQHCNFRHMELRKNRKLIPCYWENQPGGCRKPHCPFMHEKPRDTVGTVVDKTNKEVSNDGDRLGGTNDNDIPAAGGQGAGRGRRQQLPSHQSPQQQPGSEAVSGYGSPPVDPLVVNFEEESDNESVPTTTPTKKPQRKVHVKTLEEIRLERVQAESAAFYGYSDDGGGGMDLRNRLSSRRAVVGAEQDPGTFRVLTLEEIRRNRRMESGGDKSDVVVGQKRPTESAEDTNEKDVSLPPTKLRRKQAEPVVRAGVIRLKRDRHPVTTNGVGVSAECLGVANGEKAADGDLIEMGEHSEDELLCEGVEDDTGVAEDVLNDIDDLLKD